MRRFGLRDVYEYYSRDDVQQALLSFSRQREVVGVFRNGSYSARPNVILYGNDITAMVRQGSLEFHCSIERWSQPMGLKPENYGHLRTGWDLVLDLDCKAFEHGRAAAQVFCRALERHGIRGYSVKFTGGTGFHIGVPWEAFPKEIEGKPLLGMFPDLPRSMAAYLRQFVRDDFEEALLRVGDQEVLAQQAGLQMGDLEPGPDAAEGQVINPFKLVDVDSVLLSPRHLFRMPYSLNMKSFLVSLPLEPGDVPGFEREKAEPEGMKVARAFFGRRSEGEALPLVLEALDWRQKQGKAEQQRKARERPAFEGVVAEEDFPPCVKLISQGLSDGRKRSAFILLTFLRRMNWSWDSMESFVLAWNAKNASPLPENYVRSQIRWHRAQKRDIMPPACEKDGWYPAFGVCRPDETCGGQRKTVRNPVNYPLIRMDARKPRPPRPGSGRPGSVFKPGRKRSSGRARRAPDRTETHEGADAC
jgi:hypothetical protein